MTISLALVQAVNFHCRNLESLDDLISPNYNYFFDNYTFQLIKNVGFYEKIAMYDPNLLIN